MSIFGRDCGMVYLALIQTTCYFIRGFDFEGSLEIPCFIYGLRNCPLVVVCVTQGFKDVKR